MFERVDGQTGGRRLESHAISSPRAFGSGQLNAVRTFIHEYMFLLKGWLPKVLKVPEISSHLWLIRILTLIRNYLYKVNHWTIMRLLKYGFVGVEWNLKSLTKPLQ